MPFDTSYEPALGKWATWAEVYAVLLAWLAGGSEFWLEGGKRSVGWLVGAALL
jgi:hypothetical protein